MSYKAHYTYSNALKMYENRSLKIFVFYFSYSSTVIVSFKKRTHFNPKFHTLKLIKLTNVRFCIEGFFLSFIVCYK